jgi:replicative DNA helicase
LEGGYLNLASALIYRVLEESDFDTWANVRKHYLPNEYHQLFEVIEKHTENFHKLPTMEELKLEVRDGVTLDKVYALEGIETETDPYFLLEAVKNEYAQREALSQLDKWVDQSIAFETAEEVVRHIQQIGIELESKVELTPQEESMQKINLFESEDDMEKRIVLGFNDEFDSRFAFAPTDYILIGGERGSGKSITCSNIADTIVNRGKKALMFSIEMQPRELLQRGCAIATGVPHFKIRNKNLSVQEWEKVVKWWSSRYTEGEAAYLAYLEHRSFDKFHTAVSRHSLVNAHLDIVYDSSLTLGRINAEVQKRIALGEDIGIIIVDYINKVKRVNSSYSLDHLDWKEQLNVSHGLKTIAQDTGIPVFSPYQTDKTGEARLAKGILDSCDAALVLKAHKGDIPSMTFTTTKMRAADDTEEFTSEMDWNTLRIGPRSIEKPPEEQKSAKGLIGGKSKDINVQTSGVYDV